MKPSDFDPDFDPYAGLPEAGPDKRILRFIVGGLIVIGIGCFAYAAWGHDFYEFRCCSGSLDCRPVPEGAITEGPSGFVIGATGEIVPYSDTRVRQSPDLRFHWCSVAGEDDSRTLCIYAPGRGS